MNLPDTSVTLLLAGACVSAFGALWRQVQVMGKKLAKSERRFDRLLSKLATCPLLGCPFVNWAKEEMDELDEADSRDTQTLTKSIAAARVPIVPPHPPC